LRIIGDAIIDACHGYCPTSVMSTIQRSEALAERVGYDVDALLIEAWRSKLAELANNSDTVLPES
jgi:hypothetical protein